MAMPWEMDWSQQSGAKPAPAPAAQQDYNPWTDVNYLKQVYQHQLSTGDKTGSNLTYNQILELQPKQNEYSLIPVYGKDANGNPVIMQMGKNGTARATQLPEGVTVTKEPIRLDAGTKTILLSPITGEQIGEVSKNVQETATEQSQGTALGKMDAETLARAPSDIENARRMLGTVQALKTDPYRGRATGMSSVFNLIPGTGGKDYASKVDQLKGGAFMQGVQNLGGASGMTEIEGKKATDAITNLDLGQSEDAFLGQLNGVEEFLNSQIARAQKRFDAASDSTSAPRITGDAAGKQVYDKLQTGDKYIDPNGVPRTKR